MQENQNRARSIDKYDRDPLQTYYSMKYLYQGETR